MEKRDQVVVQVGGGEADRGEEVETGGREIRGFAGAA